MMRSSGLASSTFSVALRYLLNLFDSLFFAGIVVARERCDEYRGESLVVGLWLMALTWHMRCTRRKNWVESSSRIGFSIVTNFLLVSVVLMGLGQIASSQGEKTYTAGEIISSTRFVVLFATIFASTCLPISPSTSILSSFSVNTTSSI